MNQRPNRYRKKYIMSLFNNKRPQIVVRGKEINSEGYNEIRDGYLM